MSTKIHQTNRLRCASPVSAKGGLCLALLLGWSGGFSSCSTTEVAPKAAPLISPPEYVKVPHPSGYNLGDLRAIFTYPKALSPTEVLTCDAPFMKLKTLTTSESELATGARELIKQDPAYYHWCFYGKLIELEDALKKESFVDARQKKVLTTYSFLVPIARAYNAEFHDSRYLRWSIRHYKHLSEWVFFRKLDITPQMTAELVESTNPFGMVRENTPQKPILEKYGIVRTVPLVAEGAPASTGPLEAPALLKPQGLGVPVKTVEAEVKPASPSAMAEVIPSPTPKVVNPADSGVFDDSALSTMKAMEGGEVEPAAKPQPMPALQQSESGRVPAAVVPQGGDASAVDPEQPQSRSR